MTAPESSPVEQVDRECAVRIMSDRLTADRERSLPEDVVKAEATARRFHEAYERLAPSFGYETRAGTRYFDPTTPNGKLMVAVCAAIAATPPPVPEGFVLVPVVPTVDMIRAAAVADADEEQYTYSAIWSAMIAAAPASALPETGVERTPQPADQKGAQA